MDKLAAACGVDPVELRLRNAMATGDTLLTGQVIDGALPVAGDPGTAALPAAADAADGPDAPWRVRAAPG